MDTGALVRRTPGWRLAVVALAFLLPAGAARADNLIVPGGRRGISAALNIPPIDRARFLSELVRLVYAPPSGRLDARVMQERLIRYLDVLGRFRIELGLVQPAGGRVSLGSITEKADRRQAATLLEMLGLKLVEKGGALSIVPAPGKDVAERAALLNALGLDASAIAARLNAGDDVHFELPMETVPAPLTAADWARFAFAKALPADQLFAALLRDRNAALIAAALGALDDGTVQYLRGNPHVLDRLLRPRRDRVRLRLSAPDRERPRPHAGGRSRGGAVGARRREQHRRSRSLRRQPVRPQQRPARLPVLRGRQSRRAACRVRHGRLAARRGAIGAVPALAAAVQGAYSSWNIDERPSQRMAYDVAMLLATIRVGPDGAPHPPAWRQLWERAFWVRISRPSRPSAAAARAGRPGRRRVARRARRARSKPSVPNACTHSPSASARSRRRPRPTIPRCSSPCARSFASRCWC